MASIPRATTPPPDRRPRSRPCSGLDPLPGRAQPGSRLLRQYDDDRYAADVRIKILRGKGREQVGTGFGNSLLHLRCVGISCIRLKNFGKKRRKLETASRDGDVVLQLNEGNVRCAAPLLRG